MHEAGPGPERVKRSINAGARQADGSALRSPWRARGMTGTGEVIGYRVFAPL